MVTVAKRQMLDEVVRTHGSQVSRHELLPIAIKYGIRPGFLMRKKLARGVYDLAPILEEFQSLGEIAAPQAVVEKPEEEMMSYE